MSIQLILGPMFSGKTTELIRQGRRAQLAGKKVLYVKHSLDCKRYSPDDPNATNVRVHHDVGGNEQGEEALIAENLFEIWTALCSPKVQVICIDEGQFFRDLRSMCTFLVNVHRKSVIVAALNATYRKEMFPSIVDLLPIATGVQWLTAICFRCGSDQATFTKRRSQPQLEIGQHPIFGESIDPLVRTHISFILLHNLFFPHSYVFVAKMTLGLDRNI